MNFLNMSLRFRTAGSIAFGAGIGQTIGAFVGHSVFWLCVGEASLLFAFYCYQLALKQMVREIIDMLNQLKKAA